MWKRRSTVLYATVAIRVACATTNGKGLFLEEICMRSPCYCPDLFAFKERNGGACFGLKTYRNCGSLVPQALSLADPLKEMHPLCLFLSAEFFCIRYKDGGIRNTRAI